MGITDKIRKLNEADKDLYPSFVGKTLNIEISGRCNEQCIYCQYYAKGIHKVKGFIDEELFYRITKEAYELGITDVGLYMVGEPLTNVKIYDYVDYLKHKLGFKYVYISTNGILLTPENLEKLVSAGIDSIKFSVSGSSRETFLKHHGVDAFEKVYSNIRYAYEYREKNGFQYKLYMFTILTKYNKEEKWLFEKCYSPYVDELVISPVIENRCVYGVKKYLGVQEANDVLKDIQMKVPCNLLFNKIHIDEGGRLLACCYDLSNDLSVVADLNQISLKDAVYGKDFVKLRERHLKNNIEGTICDFCINGNEHNILPLANVNGECQKEFIKVDISEEIKKRFMDN